MLQDIKKELGNRIVKLRTLKGLTQSELAKKMGYTLIGISQIERGVKFASEKTIIKLCQALECTPQDLFNFKSLTSYQRNLIMNISNILEENPELIESTYKIVTNKLLKKDKC